MKNKPESLVQIIDRYARQAAKVHVDSIEHWFSIGLITCEERVEMLADAKVAKPPEIA